MKEICLIAGISAMLIGIVIVFEKVVLNDE